MEEEKLKVKIIIEILGAPEKHVQDTMQLVIKKVKELKEFEVLKDKVFDTKLAESKKLWSTFCELEVTVTNISHLINFCFDFMPSSIEILEPKKFNFTPDPLNDLLNDLIARLHQYDMLLKNMHAQNIMLKKEIEKKKE